MVKKDNKADFIKIGSTAKPIYIEAIKDLSKGLNADKDEKTYKYAHPIFIANYLSFVNEKTSP